MKNVTQERIAELLRQEEISKQFKQIPKLKSIVQQEILEYFKTKEWKERLHKSIILEINRILEDSDWIVDMGIYDMVEKEIKEYMQKKFRGKDAR